MKMRQFFYLTIFLGALTLFEPGTLQAQDEPQCGTARLLKGYLTKNHVRPRHLEVGFADSVRKSLVFSLDVNRLFFTQADFDGELAAFSQLEKAIAENSCAYLTALDDFLKTRLSYLQDYLAALDQETLLQPAGASADLQTVAALAADMTALKARWQVYLKRQFLERKYLRSTEVEMEADNQAELLSAVIEAERCKLSKKLTILEEKSDFATKAVYSAIAHAFDPHTNYYRYDFMELFQAFQEDEKPSLGFQLVENRFGQISIGKLLPGGPAWRSNQLHVGDVVTNISLSDGTKIDLSCTSLEEVEELVSGKGKSVDLTVIGSSREEKHVTLVKEKVAPNVNAVRGYLLGGEKSVGYIALPDFYTSEGEEDKERGCARDVAREIIKLKTDGIEGLIIDVRNNGGGSLQEALDLIGIFIDEGPLALMKKEEKIQVIGDRSRGAAYFGPLIILVNGQSASASELLAASLQDYNRALIVGDTTFGKAVGQEVKVLATLISEGESKELSPSMVKVTTSRLYRLKGQSYQQQGIAPDIYIPELLVNSTRSEADYPFSINREHIERDTYFKAYPEFPLARLRESHEARLRSLGFLRAKALTDSIRLKQEALTSLDPQDFLSVRMLKQKKQSWLQQQLGNDSKPFNADNHSFDRMIISISPQKKAD